MIFNQKNLRGMVNKLLGDFSNNITLKEQVSGTYDPTLGAAPQTVKEYVYKGGVFNYTVKGSGEGVDLDSLIQKDDRKVYLVPREDGITPNTGNWFVKIDGQWWAIVSIKNTSPAGYALLHELQIRKA